MIYSSIYGKMNNLEWIIYRQRGVLFISNEQLSTVEFSRIVILWWKRKGVVRTLINVLWNALNIFIPKWETRIIVRSMRMWGINHDDFMVKKSWRLLHRQIMVVWWLKSYENFCIVPTRSHYKKFEFLTLQLLGLDHWFLSQIY